ncbi:hypothetical protein DRE_02097 [Drechslerella stenobrocha 248]|uniref:Uncharacterized protein n=1 Tax=Drechslerella stenobrocha 248 TaxID=1043628 RepID=W7I7M7_9PEZI|nr:hypothetical protein DRE_02097 [Drechslerella stenobrocha 248]
MPAVLLPRTAAPFAERSAPTIVLDTAVNPWLAQTLKRVNRHKRPLNSVPQHLKCLTEILSGPNAIWNLCSLCVPKLPDAQIEQQSNPITDALLRYQFIHLQAYVVSIDMVQSHQIAFKLTKESIKSLVDYHKDVYMIDQVANTWHWAEKDAAAKKMHEEFVQKVNKYVFQTDKIALEGIEDDGAGELLCGQSEEVRNAISEMFFPLQQPAPKPVEVRAPTPTLASNPAPIGWWAPTAPSDQHMAPVEPWKILPSNNPATAAQFTTGMVAPSMAADNISNWGFDEFNDNNALAFGTAFMDENSVMGTAGPYATSIAASSDWWSPQVSPSPHEQTEHLPFMPVTTGYEMPSVSMPAMYNAQPCSSALNYGGFGWDNTNRYMDFATTM